MVQRPSHRIRRQRWVVAARSEPQAFNLSRRLRADLDDVLLPALAAGFDEVARGDDVIHLARLEFHVRIARVEDVADKLPGFLSRAAAAQLRAMADRWSASAVHVRARRHSPDEERVRLLASYLETGVLPWQHGGVGDADVRADLAAAVPRWLDQAAGAVRARTWSRRHLTALVLRLLQIAPAHEWVGVAQALASDLPPVTRARVLAAVAVVAGAGSPEATAERQAIWITIAQAIEVPPRAIHRADMVAAVAAALEARAAALSRSDRLRLAAAAIAAARLEPQAAAVGEAIIQLEAPNATVSRGARRQAAVLVRRWLAGMSGPTPTPTLPAARRGLGTRAVAARPGGPQARGPARSNLHERAQSLRTEHPAPHAPVEDFALLVSHGGLILLHPYLPRLFARTGITNAGATELNPAVLPRAAALLYLLATGRVEALELELGFIKVLLGLALHEPLLVADGLLGERDRAEVDALLHAVIAQWSVLRATSADGLRASFLRRPALLHQEADGWRLRVQSHAIDVLLDHLPWAIGIARLPWMAQPIFTEWQVR